MSTSDYCVYVSVCVCVSPVCVRWCVHVVVCIRGCLCACVHADTSMHLKLGSGPSSNNNGPAEDGAMLQTPNNGPRSVPSIKWHGHNYSITRASCWLFLIRMLPLASPSKLKAITMTFSRTLLIRGGCNAASSSSTRGPVDTPMRNLIKEGDRAAIMRTFGKFTSIMGPSTTGNDIVATIVLQVS